ncbi:Trafficking protein particle complex 8 [Allomyces javanicus]|nr:Trafficking protein particle complex 8 [Allomyces javanicus]
MDAFLADRSPRDVRASPAATHWVHSVLAPKVAIITTPDVRPLLAERGISSLSHFLAPFAAAPVHCRDAFGNMYSVPDFPIRLVEINLMDPPVSAADVSDRALAEVVANVGEVQQGGESTAGSSDEDPDRYPTPWFDRYRKWFLSLFPATEHECFEHPIAILYVVSTRCPEPVAALARLTNLASSLPVFEQGWMDPNLQRYHVLLHDSDVDDYACTGMLDAMKRAFGLYCAALPLRPLSNDTSAVAPDVWAPLRAEHEWMTSITTTVTGSAPDSRPTPSLVQVDMAAVAGARALMSSLLNHLLVPYMQRSTALWNETVAAPRRGITGRLFSASRKYFGRSASPAAGTGNTSPTSGHGIAYAHSAHEALLRKLGDYAFMLRDYRLALQTYQTAARAYTTDRAWRYLAGVHEMMALCHALLGAVKDADANHELAVSTYATRARAPHYAARATLLLAPLLADDDPAGAAGVYVRQATLDSDVRSALALEQAAAMFLHRGMRRKALIYLVLAGNRYTKAQLRAHSIRCYSAAQRYLPARWTWMSDHVHLALGRQYYHVAQLDAAVSEMMRLVHPGQSLVLEELMYLYSQHSPAQAVVQELDQIVPDVLVPDTITLCVHELSTWQATFVNPMQIPMSICAPAFLADDTSIVSVTHDGGAAAALECDPLADITAKFTLTGLAVGTSTIASLTYRLHDMIPIRVPLGHPITVTVTSPRPKLDVTLDLPSVVFASQIQRVDIILHNAGMVATGPIAFNVDRGAVPGLLPDTDDSDAARVRVCLDDDAAWPTSLDAGATAHVVAWIQWDAAVATFTWRYGTNGSMTYQLPVHVTMVPLLAVTSARTQWFAHGALAVAVDALHQALAGTFHAPGAAPSETYVLAPRQTVTHVFLPNSGGPGNGGGWRATMPVACPASLLDAPSDWSTVYFAWTLNAWTGVARIAVPRPPALAAELTLPDTAHARYTPLDAVLTLVNSTARALHVQIEFKSDAALIVTGRVRVSLAVPAKGVETVHVPCVPLAPGVIDVAACAHVAVAEGEMGPWADVAVEPAYVHVVDDGGGVGDAVDAHVPPMPRPVPPPPPRGEVEAPVDVPVSAETTEKVVPSAVAVAEEQPRELEPAPVAAPEPEPPAADAEPKPADAPESTHKDESTHEDEPVPAASEEPAPPQEHDSKSPKDQDSEPPTDHAPEPHQESNSEPPQQEHDAVPRPDAPNPVDPAANDMPPLPAPIPPPRPATETAVDSAEIKVEPTSEATNGAP